MYLLANGRYKCKINTLSKMGIVLTYRCKPPTFANREIYYHMFFNHEGFADEWFIYKEFKMYYKLCMHLSQEVRK